MGTVLASSILDRARTILHDSGATRWPEPEMLQWLNLGQREIALQRPEAYVTNQIVKLSPGARQAVPPSAVRLLDVVRNMGVSGAAPGRPVTLVARDMLDVEDPAWNYGTPANSTIHYTFDERDPHTFYVYPPSDGAGYIEIVVSAAPPDILATSSAIALDDVYQAALLDYVLYRSYAKDSGTPQNAQRAVAFYQAFGASLGLKLKADVQSDPNLNTTPPVSVPPVLK